MAVNDNDHDYGMAWLSMTMRVMTMVSGMVSHDRVVNDQIVSDLCLTTSLSARNLQVASAGPKGPIAWPSAAVSTATPPPSLFKWAWQ